MSAQPVRVRLQHALDALQVASIALQEALDALPEEAPNDLIVRRGELSAPASEQQRRQVAALRKLLRQPHSDGVSLTAVQAEREIAHWTGIAQTQPARSEHYDQLSELIAGLALDGIAVAVPDGTMSIATYISELRRLKALRAGRATPAPETQSRKE